MEKEPAVTFAKKKPLMVNEDETPIEETITSQGRANTGVLVNEENVALEQQKSGYIDARLGVFIVNLIHLFVVIGFLIAYYYFSADAYYYGYQAFSTTVPPPGDCCNCTFPHWKPFILGLIYMIALINIFVTIWVIGESPRRYLRFQFYVSVLEWLFALIYVILIVMFVVSLFWCNGPGFNLNLCNDKKWECRYNYYANVTAPTCFTCPSFPMPMSDLVWNPAFVVTMIFTIVSFVIFVISIILMDVYVTNKLKYSTYGLADPVRTRLRQYKQIRLLSNISCVIAAFILSAIIGSIIYLLATSPESEFPSQRHYEFPAIDPPGTLIDESFNTKWILYFIWSLTGLIIPFVIALCAFPTTGGRSKSTAAVFLAIWMIKDVALLIVLLVLYLSCNISSLNPCYYPPNTAIASPIFRVVAICTLVELVLETVLLVIFIIQYKLIAKLVRLEGDVRQFDILSHRAKQQEKLDELAEESSQQ